MVKAEKIKHFNIPIFVPEQACPNRCVFCNQHRITGMAVQPDIEQVIATIEEHLTTIDPLKSHVEIAFFGGNFTGISIDKQKEYLEAVQPYIDKGFIKGVRISTRPDYVTEEILRMLRQYRVISIELGAQSLDDEVLEKAGRGHSLSQVEEASILIKKYGFELGLQMMIGLPGDSALKCLKTAERIINLKADTTRIYPTLVIKGTQLEELYQQGMYKPLSIEEAVEWTAPVYWLFHTHGIKILRVGLHASEGLMSGEDMVAGPFHQSFREMVLSEIWKTIFYKAVNSVVSDKIRIHVSPEQLNYAVGYKCSNKKHFLASYKWVEFCKDDSLKDFEYLIESI